MQYHLDADPKTEPTLAEMTRAAIEVLQNNTKGYFLFVEGNFHFLRRFIYDPARYIKV